MTPVWAQPTLPDFSAATFSNSLIIDNPYHPLQVGQQRVYRQTETDPDTGEVSTETIEIIVLDEVRIVHGVDARVVRDRVYLDGKIIEDTFDWFAQDDVGNVWYMGESVTDYHYDDEGNLTGTSHPGEWEAGVGGASAGYIMPAALRVGDSFYTEFLAGEAVDEFEQLALGESHTVPYGTFTDVLRTADRTALDPDVLEHKFYAPGIGKILSHDIDIETGAVLGRAELVSYVVPEPTTMSSILIALLLLVGLDRRS